MLSTRDAIERTTYNVFKVFHDLKKDYKKYKYRGTDNTENQVKSRKTFLSIMVYKSNF